MLQDKNARMRQVQSPHKVKGHVVVKDLSFVTDWTFYFYKIVTRQSIATGKLDNKERPESNL